MKEKENYMLSMSHTELCQLSQQTFNNYLWIRLRSEEPVNPAERFGQEPPEAFVIDAMRKSEDSTFKIRLVEAIRENLRRLSMQLQSETDSTKIDFKTDQQLASLAFLASRIDVAAELVPDFYAIVSTEVFSPVNDKMWSAGQFNILRVIAFLQSDKSLASFWQKLWENGPVSGRGLTILGWARVDEQAAFDHLEELINLGNQIDVPSTLWTLAGSKGPGLDSLARHTARFSDSIRSKIREGLRIAGADKKILDEFDRIVSLHSR